MFEQELIDAAKSGNIVLVKKYLEDGVSPAAEDNLALRLAAANGHRAVVEVLLAHPKIDYTDNSTTFRSTVWTLKVFITQAKVDPTADDNFAIRWAAANGHAEVVKILLEHPSVDPAARDSYAIRYAATNGHAEVIKLLCMHKKISHAACGKAIVIAAEKGHLAVVQSLICPKTSCYAANDAIIAASRYGHAEIVRFLIARPKLNPAASGNLAIRLAVENGHLAVVKLLTAHPNVDLTVEENLPICLAAHYGHVDVVKFLLTHQEVDPAAKRNYAIEHAAKNGHVEVVKLLITHPKVNPYYIFNLAVEKGQPKVVEFLLSQQLNIKLLDDPFATKNNYGFSSAVYNGHISVLKALLAHSSINTAANINNAILAAVEYHNAAVVKFLLPQCTVDLAANDYEIFRKAVRFNNPEIVEMLDQYSNTCCVAIGRSLRSVLPSDIAYIIADYLYNDNCNNKVMHSRVIAAHNTGDVPKQYDGWGKTGDTLVRNMRLENPDPLLAVYNRKSHQLNTSAITIQKSWRGHIERKQQQVATRHLRLLK